MKTDEIHFPFMRSVARGKQILEIVGSLLDVIGKSKTECDRLIAAGKIHEIGREFSSALLAYAAARGEPEADARAAIVYLKVGETTKALAAIKAFTNANPEFRFADISGRPLSGLTILGDAYRESGDIAAAQQAYEAALDLVPDDSQAAGQLARMFIAQEEVAKAIDLGNRFLDSDEMAALHATTRLLVNDPHRLPALGGMVHSFAARLSDVR